MQTFYLLGPIIPESLEIIRELREFSSNDPESPICIILSSEGGLEDVGYAIFDTILGLPNHVTIEGVGEVCSIAALIFQAADYRVLTPNCQLMMHNGSFEMAHPRIEIDELPEMAIHFGKSVTRYTNSIANRCNISVDKNSKMV